MRYSLLFVMIFFVFSCSLNLKLDKKDYITPPKSFNEQISGNFTIEKRWWERFNDPNLNYIINKILKNSLDIKIMETNLNIVKKRYEQELSTIYPELNLQSDVTRKGQHTENIFGQKVYTLGNSYSLSLFASYELDLFNKLKTRQRSYYHSFLQTKYEKKAAVQSIVIQGISLYFSLSYLKYKKDILEKLIEIAEQKYRLAKMSYENGLIDLTLLKTYENLIKAQKSEHLLVKKEIKDKYYSLSMLVSQYPNSDFKITNWDKISLDALTIKPGIPSDLLKRRPDICALDEKLKSLEAKAKVARKTRFPSITLTGSAGFASLELKNLLLSESNFFSIGGQILQPLFNAGKLKRQEEIAILDFRNAEIEFANAVLNAFKEVESVLNVEKTLFEQYSLINEILQNRKKQLQLQNIKYRFGKISLLELKEMEENYLDDLLTKEQNKLDLLINKLNLIKALGGDW